MAFIAILRMRQGYVVSFFRANGLTLKPQSRYPVRVRYRGRAPTQEELRHLIDISGLREKAIISMLATSGMRIGTLLKLKYRHVREGLEAGRVPLHIHIEAEITKGKYADYDTFINEEAVHYLRLYLEARRMGTEKLPAEKIDDESPLFANAGVERNPKGSDHKGDRAGIEGEGLIVKHLSYGPISHVLFRSFERAGLIAKDEKRHQLRIHRLRKFFRTQLTTLGMPTDYVEYMMGHKLSTYLTVESKGIDFLSNVYSAANLRIFPKEKSGLKDVLRAIIRSSGEDPAKYLRQEIMGGRDLIGEEEEAEIYARAVWEMLRRELVPSDYTTPESSNKLINYLPLTKTNRRHVD